MACLKQCRKKQSCVYGIVKYISNSGGRRYCGVGESGTKRERTLDSLPASNDCSITYLTSVVRVFGSKHYRRLSNDYLAQARLETVLRTGAPSLAASPSSSSDLSDRDQSRIARGVI